MYSYQGIASWVLGVVEVVVKRRSQQLDMSNYACFEWGSTKLPFGTKVSSRFVFAGVLGGDRIPRRVRDIRFLVGCCFDVAMIHH